MNKRHDKLQRSIFLVLALLLLAIAGNLPADELKKILLVPFDVVSDGDDSELKSLGEHMDEQIRACIESLGGEYKIDKATVGRSPMRDHDALRDEDEIKKTAKDSHAAFVIYGSISVTEDRYRLRGTMWDVANERGVVSIDLKVPNIHSLPSLFHVFIGGITKRLHGVPTMPFYKAEHPFSQATVHPVRLRTPVGVPRGLTPWRSPEIAGGLTGIAIGDVDGDKRNETVVVGDAGVTIKRFENDGFRPLTHFSQAPAICLGVQAEDLDGDGVAELIVCYQSPFGLFTEVVRYLNRNLTIAGRYPDMILACVPHPSASRSRLLLGQRTDVENMFSGEMVQFEMDRGQPVPAERVHLPTGTLLLSYTSGMVGTPRGPLQAIIDQNQRLLLFDAANNVVSRIDDPAFRLDRKLRVKTQTGLRDIVWPGKLVISDMNSDGQNELLVAGNLNGKGEIHAFRLEGSHLVKRWNTPPREGVISDFAISDFRTNGIKSLVLLLMKPDPLLAVSGPRSVVYAYDFGP